jgi:hypothetical protein
MKRFWTAAAAACLLLATLPAGASARMIEIGATTSPLISPVCPANVTQANCTIVLTQVTALESARDGIAYPTKITKAGDIVAFSLGVSALSSKSATVRSDIQYLNGAYGGTAQAELTVLRPTGRRSRNGWMVAAESPSFQLQPYLGQVVQFPLAMPLPVVPGEVLALTVPTWAPVLTFNLTPNLFSYRQSRKVKCVAAPGIGQAQSIIGQRAQYGCSYAGTRVEYSATEITTPVPNVKSTPTTTTTTPTTTTPPKTTTTPTTTPRPFG